MKGPFKLVQLFSLLLLVVFLISCSSYNWERKRYYKSDKKKNWNNYNSKKTKKEEDRELDKYYKKY